jgi:transposase InsO family protein
MALVMTRRAAMMKLMDATLAAGVEIANVAGWCRANGVDRRTFYRHRQRIAAEGSWQARSRRPERSPAQTPAKVAEEIVRLRAELAPDNGADAIAAALQVIAAGQDWTAAGLMVPHRSTVNRVLKRAGLVTAQPRKRPRSSFRRFAYARPRDCYQIDATELKLAGGQPAVVFDVLDDCTRLLAACHAAPAETAAAAAAAITAAARACGAPAIVLCDNSAAFSGGRARGQGAFARAVAGLGSRLIHSSPHHPQTCGKVERHHQTLKKWLATQPAPATLPGLQTLLDAYRDYYNNRRHHTAIRGTPARAWHNAASHGGPGHLPRQDDATVHKLTIGRNGHVDVGRATIHISKTQAGQVVTAIRDRNHVTIYTTTGQPLGHVHLDYSKRYQGTITPAD